MSTCLGHLLAESRDLMLKRCTKLAERGLGIGQLGLQESLCSGVAEYVLTSRICKWSSGNTYISVGVALQVQLGLWRRGVAAGLRRAMMTSGVWE